MHSAEGIVTGDSGEGRAPKCQGAALEGWVTVECQGERQFWYEEWSFAGSVRACGWICLPVSWPGATAGPGASQNTQVCILGHHPCWEAFTLSEGASPVNEAGRQG